MTRETKWPYRHPPRKNKLLVCNIIFYHLYVELPSVLASRTILPQINLLISIKSTFKDQSLAQDVPCSEVGCLTKVFWLQTYLVDRQVLFVPKELQIAENHVGQHLKINRVFSQLLRLNIDRLQLRMGTRGSERSSYIFYPTSVINLVPTF